MMDVNKNSRVALTALSWTKTLFTIVLMACVLYVTNIIHNAKSIPIYLYFEGQQGVIAVVTTPTQNNNKGNTYDKMPRAKPKNHP